MTSTFISPALFSNRNQDFSSGSDGKESACNVGDLGSIPGLRRSPGEGNGNPLQYSYLENPHGQRCLAGQGPWGRQLNDFTFLSEPLRCKYSTGFP